MDYQNPNGYELDWNSEIENEGQEFILAPAGDYDFVVTGFERARHNGSDKIPPCNKAVLSIQVETPKGPATIRHNLLLHSKCEWKLCEFFTSIGQRKKGQRVTMNWNAVTGARGRCKVSVRKFTSKTTGKEMETNDIDKFYEPDADLPFTTPYAGPPAQQQPAYTQTSFANQGGYTPGKF